MKPEELKLYNKYRYIYIYIPNIKYIYIGKNNFRKDYWFIYKNIDNDLDFNVLELLGFNPEQIIKDLNLETYIDEYGFKKIKGCTIDYFIEENLIHLKPILKDKLKNIINR